MDIKNVHFLKRITNKMDLTYYRNSDVITGSEDLENIYTIKNFPVFMGATEQPYEEDQFVDMCFQVSKSSGMVQINPLVNLNVVYQSSHNPGTIGQIWKDHHKALSDFIMEFDKKTILEIGGYSGILANHCLSSNPEINWTIIDPHVKSFDEKIHVINDFFDEKFSSSFQYDLIVHSHLIEHVIDIKSFMSTCHKNLNDNGYMIFSLPNLNLFIEKKLTNCLNFEHTFYIDEFFLSKLFEIHGFELINKKYYDRCYSIFYCVKKSSNFKTVLDDSKYDEYKNMFLKYFEDINNFIIDANKKFETEKDIFVFGGHVTSQFLLCLGLDKDRITYLLDNDPKKQDKRLYGTDLIIKSPEILSNYQSPLLVLKNSLFDEEIKQQILKINKDVRILSF